MKTITIDELAALDPSITLVDVREPQEYLEAHVPGAVLYPLGHLPARMSELAKDQPIYVICRSGNRSKVGVELLAAQGFDATNVAGGTDAWIRSDRHVVTGREPR